MPRIPYSDVVNVLLDAFPEFMETEDYDPEDMDLPYMVWGGFGKYATTYIRRLPADRLDDDPFVARVFDFANRLMDSGDEETRNIVVIELFENFMEYTKTFELARRKLKPRHLNWLEILGPRLGTDDLHYEGEFVAPLGLKPLSDVFDECSWEIKVRESDPGGGPYIESHDARIKLSMDRGQGPLFSFFGSILVNPSEARSLLGELSDRLAQAAVTHRITLYQMGREDTVLDYFHHSWPNEGTNGHE